MSRFDALRQRKTRSKAATPKDDLNASLANAGKLLDEVTEAADRAAKAIGADADAHGSGREQKIDRDRLAAELMRSLAERTEALGAESRELVRILGRASTVISASTEAEKPEPEPAPAAPPEPAKAPKVQGGGLAAPPERPTSFSRPKPAPVEPSAPAPKPAERPVAAAGDGTRPTPPSEGLRLLATQMAVAGSTQIEIEERLRSEFGVADADAILAQVFGAKG